MKVALYKGRTMNGWPGFTLTQWALCDHLLSAKRSVEILWNKARVNVDKMEWIGTNDCAPTHLRISDDVTGSLERRSTFRQIYFGCFDDVQGDKRRLP